MGCPLSSLSQDTPSARQNASFEKFLSEDVTCPCEHLSMSSLRCAARAILGRERTRRTRWFGGDSGEMQSCGSWLLLAVASETSATSSHSSNQLKMKHWPPNSDKTTTHALNGFAKVIDVIIIMSYNCRTATSFLRLPSQIPLFLTELTLLVLQAPSFPAALPRQ
jgi:hypothetical protein